jgi:hypothetical protein
VSVPDTWVTVYPGGRGYAFARFLRAFVVQHPSPGLE